MDLAGNRILVGCPPDIGALHIPSDRVWQKLWMWIKLGDSGKHFFWDVKLIFELIFFRGFAVNDFKLSGC